MRNSHTVKIKIQKMEKSQLRILILTHTDFWYLQVLNSKNQNLIRLIITILILIISILSYLEVKKHHYGWDTMDLMTMSERILIMVKNKVVLKERDVWSDLANFIGEMVAKYAEAMNLDNLPDPDIYLHRERIRQLYTELYKEKNITKFRNTKISIERKVAA